jgi:iron complex transport system substrate-binding protein
MTVRNGAQSWRRAAILMAALLVLGASAAAGATIALRDASGREVQVGDRSRIVSIGGAVTEILYALGAEQRIVAVDSTSLFPAQALKQKPNVGYMRQLSPEGVLGLNPSLILAVEGAGPPETLAVLRAASIPLVVVPDQHSGEGILAKIRTIAEAIDAKPAGECLAATVEADLDALARMRAQIARPKRVLFVLSFVNGRAMAAGRGTAAEGIIHLAGARNAIEAYGGYKPISDESVVAARPDIVLAMQRGGEQLTAETVFAHPGFALTPAAERKSFIAMDGLYLLGFGPRTARAARDLARSIDPTVPRADLPSERGEANADCRP